MAPMRRSFGGWSRLNNVINQDTWEHNYKTVDKPLAQFAGDAAHAQLRDELDFVNEQPTGSSMYDEKPWPEVVNHPRTSQTIFDQCQFGQKNSNGEPVKNSTALLTSDTDLPYYFEGLTCGRFPKRCNGKHAHLTGREANVARKWP